MKHLKHFSFGFWLILATAFVLALAGCNTPIATSAAATPPVQDTPNAQTAATIHGKITYQAPPTPTSMLYLISPAALVFLGSSKRQPVFSLRSASGSRHLPAGCIPRWE